MSKPINLTPVVRYRKPPQLRALGARHAVVEASAGTGKTYILEHLVVDLLLSRGATIDQILVVTFTEKATAELATRIRRKLEELKSLTADHANVGDAAAAPEDLWTIDDVARARLADALLGFDRAAISTIHGFCQRLLTEHAFLNGRLFREEAVAEEEAFGVAFAECLRREPARAAHFAQLLSLWLGSGNALAKLRKGVLQALRGLSCLYPPRPDALIPSPPDPAAIVTAAQTFALLPTGEALRALLKQAKLHASTTKSVVEKWSQLHELATACTRAEDVPVFLAAVDVFHRNRDNALTYLHERLDPAAPLLRPVALGLRALVDATPSPLAALVAHLVPVVQERLASNKRQAGRFDFQDMLTLVAEGLKGQGGVDDERSQALLGTLRGRYRSALIDEFQDTDEVQWNIFRKIFF
ncbi:MAG TPA: UvrD-helicase domain-containing protein, partial [Polyangia bacterium]